MEQTPKLLHEQQVEDRHFLGLSDSQKSMKRALNMYMRHLSSHSLVLSVIPGICSLNNIPSHALTVSEEYSNHLYCLASVARESIMARRAELGRS